MYRYRFRFNIFNLNFLIKMVFAMFIVCFYLNLNFHVSSSNTYSKEKYLPSTTTIQSQKANTSHDFNSCNFMKYNSNQLNNFTDICDLMITIKTTHKNYKLRLDPILRTWYRLVHSKVIKLFVYYFI